MNVLLTGGTGYIGSHAAVVMALAGHNVVLFDNFCNSQPNVAKCIAKITGQNIALVEGDVRDSKLLAYTLRQYSVTAVMHFAGLKAVGESVQQPVEYYANNVQGTISLLQAMKKTGVRQLVFSSSATVYGEAQYLPYDENHPRTATNPYGRTKLQVEEMLEDLAASDASWHIALLRYFNPVGAHESGLIGELPNGIPNNLMPFVAQVAAGQRAYLSVFGADYDTLDGTGERDYIHVMDLVEGHRCALEWLQGNQGCTAFNLGTGQGNTVLEMVKAFELVSGRRVPYQIVERRSGDVAKSYANAEKARSLLKWSAQRTLDDMCASTWNWQRQFLQN